MSVMLTGYRGSGKTTVGKLLAARLGYPFLDADDVIVQRTGKTIREIFAQSGEAGFRDLESAVVRDLVALSDHVIALGGGALLRDENRQVIAAGGHRVIYLSCDPHELLRRIQSDVKTAETRPHLSQLGGGIEEIRNLLAFREPIYQAAMTDQLDVTGLSPEQATEAIAKMLSSSKS